MRFNELDIVRSLADKGSTPAGSEGTIIFVFDKPKEAYMVEFVDECGEAIDDPVYLPDEIELVKAFRPSPLAQGKGPPRA